MGADLTSWGFPRVPNTTLPLVLGTMNFGKRTNEAESRRILDHAFERGVTHWDTANAYVDGEGERIVGRALEGRRSKILLATKVGLLRLGGTTSGLLQSGGKPEGLSRARIVTACDESLKRLKTDYIDLYYLHVPDPGTPIEDTLAGIEVLIRAGKIRAWALSNYASWQVLEMIFRCNASGLPRPLMAQQMYNLLVRQLDVEYLRFASRYGLHTAAYNPLAGGLLARPNLGEEPPPGSRFDGNSMYRGRYYSDVMRRRVEDYRAVADDLGLSLATLAYAWLAARPGVDSVLLGPGSTSHLDAAIDGVRVALDPAMMARLDALHVAQQGSDAKYAR